MELFHGSNKNTTLTPHIGICLTDSESSAEAFAGGNENQVYTIDIDLSGLTIADMDDGYDRENDIAPGDDADDITEMQNDGIDVITYTDEDEFGRQHDCWRIISALALSRF